jgi:hypothetical protein
MKVAPPLLGWVSGALLLVFTSEMVFSGTGSSYRDGNSMD